MPGILVISQAETFTRPPIVMEVAPRLKFGSSEDQDVTRDGEPKWTVQAAVSYAPQFGMKPVAEVIEVTITGADPSADVPPGTPVEFNRLQVGVSAPEQRERKEGGTRVVGGKLYWMAAGVRPAGARAAQVA
jgi:hypothetical protein